MTQPKTRWVFGGYGKVKSQSLAKPKTQQEYVEAAMDLYREDKSVLLIYEKAFIRGKDETDKVFMRRAAKLDYNDHKISKQFILKDA